MLVRERAHARWIRKITKILGNIFKENSEYQGNIHYERFAVINLEENKFTRRYKEYNVYNAVHVI